MKKAKSVLSVLLALVMVLCAVPVAVGAESLTQVPEGYIGVSTVEDLYCVRNDLTANYILMNDIDLTEATAEGGDWDYGGRGWNPIGSEDVYSNSAFSGIFDGNGYRIKGLRIDVSSVPEGTASSSYVGLFSYNSGIIKNLTIVSNINVSSNYISFVGPFAGRNDGVIEDCVSYATITSELSSSRTRYTGGIVGYNKGDVNRCAVTGVMDITCLAYPSSGSIENYCMAGGITGCNEGAITKALNTASFDVKVHTSGYYHKVVSNLSGTKIYSYYGKSTVHTAGISGKSSGTASITDCFNCGSFSVDLATHRDDPRYGLIYNYSSGICYDGNIKNCYNTGVITTTTSNAGVLENYEYIISSAEVTKCYYPDTLLARGTTGAVSLTEPQMKIQFMYSGWDFDTVWTMDGREEYPYPELRDVPLIFPEDCKTPISGSVTVTGEAKVGSTLTAVITGLTPADATVTYEWKADGVVVGTEASYTVTQDDVGKKITLTVKGDGEFGGSLEASAIVGECVHALGEFTLNNDATCTKNETKSAVCEKCGATVTEEIEGTKLSHSFTNYLSDNNATCTADGTKTAKCDNCDATDTIADTGSMTAHSFTNYISNGDATCTADGTKTAKCDRCDATDTVADVDSAKGHTEEVIPVVKATCTAKGMTEGKKCSVCGEILVAPTETDALGHSFTNYISNGDATCTADGTKTAKCDRCDATDTVSDAGTKLPHRFTVYVSDNNATCTADGTKTAKCDRCDAIDTVSDAGTKLPHSFTNYISDNNATCTADGTKTAKCNRCDATDTVADAGTKLPHRFTVYVSDNNATCTTDGTKTAKCDRCDATDTVVDAGSAKGHTEIVLPAAGATCTEVGKTAGSKCAVCGEILVAQKVIPALGHDMSEFVVIRNSTCKEKGESRSTCSRCGYTETRTLPLTEHTDADGDGHCDDCKETIGTQTSCNCICHGHGIKTLIYKILLFVQKIIQIDLVNRVMHIGRVCKCGEIHY